MQPFSDRRRNPAYRIQRWHYPVACLALLCVLFAGYAGFKVFKEVRLVDRAFPSLPSAFATDLETSMLFSPVRSILDRSENGFLRLIKYPPLTIPNAPLPTANLIGDQIHQAQLDQGLVVRIGPGSVLPLDDIARVAPSSMDAVGRAMYLSQNNSQATRDFEDGKGPSTLDDNFAGRPAVDQLREIFEIAYGRKALEQVTQPER